MRILMVGPGKTIALRRVLDWVCRRGDQVCLVAEENPYTRSMPANYTFVPSNIDANVTLDEMATPAAELQARYQPVVEQLQALAATFQPDVIHLHFLNTLTYCCVKAGLQPLVVSVWGLFNSLLTTPQTQLPNLAMRQMVAAAKGLIVESPALLACCERLETRPPHLALIPLGANTRVFRPASPAQRRLHRRALAIEEDTVVLLSPRGWSKIYQHRQIFTAYRLARPHFTKPTMLLFLKLGRVVTDQEVLDLYRTMETEVAQYGLTDEVRWLPEVLYEVMPTIYNLADIVINYPRHDAFPSTLVEAIACERPVITAQLPGYQNTFIEEFCTLVEPSSSSEPPLALADAMIKMVNDGLEQHKSQLQRARQVIVEQYDETIAQQRLFALYDNLNGPSSERVNTH